jgi:hypothetical protein
MAKTTVREYQAVIKESAISGNSSLVVSSWTEPSDSTPRINIRLSGKSLENFKKMVSRGMNTWDSAPAELKEFADLLIEGKILQDYSSFETAKENCNG